LALDNLSGLSQGFSDALCRFSTGGGHTARQLYTDMEEVLVEIQRPCILNGITDIATSPDLVDRSLAIHLPSIADDKRETEAELWTRFHHISPRILGALLDAVSGALRQLSSVQMKHFPRMADFAKWITAAESTLGWEPGQFMAVYYDNIHAGVEVSIEASPFGNAVREFIEERKSWRGTMTQLIAAIEQWGVSDRVSGSREWPRSPKSASGVLRRLAPPLRKLGISVEFNKSGKRWVHLDYRPENASKPSNSSNAAPHKGFHPDASGTQSSKSDASPEFASTQKGPPDKAMDAMDATDAKIPPNSKSSDGETLAL
jgi:hypothetical protein